MCMRMIEGVGELFFGHMSYFFIKIVLVKNTNHVLKI